MSPGDVAFRQHGCGETATRGSRALFGRNEWSSIQLLVTASVYDAVASRRAASGPGLALARA
jgi:hypothetical protein